MKPTDPQFLYMVLILPGLFGLTLIGEGLVKIYHEKFQGVFSLVLGIVFVLLAILGYFYFSNVLS